MRGRHANGKGSNPRPCNRIAVDKFYARAQRVCLGCPRATSSKKHPCDLAPDVQCIRYDKIK